MARTFKAWAIAVVFVTANGAIHAQNNPEDLKWTQSGNCWYAEPGFLYCGQTHPLTPNNAGTFLSVICFEHYHAILLNHPKIEKEVEIRTIHSNFGKHKYSDIWIAASQSESFFSNHIQPSNDPYHNALIALANPNTMKFEFTIEPGDVKDSIPMTGQEHHAVNAYLDACVVR